MFWGLGLLGLGFRASGMGLRFRAYAAVVGWTGSSKRREYGGYMGISRGYEGITEKRKDYLGFKG